MHNYVIDCLGIAGIQSTLYMVSEVKGNTAVVFWTNPIKKGQILTPPIFFKPCSMDAIRRSNQMSEHKPKDSIAILMTNRIERSL